MAQITKPITFVSGGNFLAADINNDLDTIYNDYNGNIDNSNIVSSANIAWSKVSKAGSVLSDLANVNASSPYDGQILTYQASSGTWIPGTGNALHGIIESGQQVSSALTVTTSEQDLPSSAISTGTLNTGDILMITVMLNEVISSSSGATTTVYLNVAGSDITANAATYQSQGGTSWAGGGTIVYKYTVPSGGQVALKLTAIKSSNNGTSQVQGVINYIAYR